MIFLLCNQYRFHFCAFLVSENILKMEVLTSACLAKRHCCVAWYTELNHGETAVDLQ